MLWRAVHSGSDGAFNVAGEPVLGSADVAAALGARRLPMPIRLLGLVMDASSALRVQPLDRSWLDLLTQVPLVSSDRAKEELGWRPAHHASRTLVEVVEAAYAGAGTASPRLAPR